ncbi:MAG: AAA family ATPase [Gemmataceae bacterium]
MGELASDRLDEFFRAVALRNPFLDNRINGPSAHDVDVDAIHQTAFARLTRLAREACAHGRGVGVVLWGEAGIGKSHLLSRLARWAKSDKQAYFVYLHNLQAAPEHLPRSVLGTVVNTLTSGPVRQFAGTQLHEMVLAVLLDVVDHKRDRQPWTRLANAYRRWVQRLTASELPGATLNDRRIWDVLYLFFRSACRARQGKEDGSVAELAVRWLSGQTLDAEEARALELPPPRRVEESVALLDNQQIKQVLAVLTRLAACMERPFLLMFDQVDNLDVEQVGALARFLQALIDSSPNLLVVTAGVKDTLLRWHENRVIQESAWDRLAQENLTLQRLQPAEAAAILEARLRSFLAPFADLELVRKRQEEDALFPLGAAWRQRFFGERLDIRPRDAINWAREGWRQQQEALAHRDPRDWLTCWPRVGEPNLASPTELSREEIQGSLEAKIAEKLAVISAQLEREPHSLPTDADHLAGLAYALLIQCRDAGHLYGVWEVRRVSPKKGRPTYHLSLCCRPEEAAAEVRTGILILMERNATSVTAYLRRLQEDWGAYDRVVVATAETVGLPLGDTGREHLEDLRRRGGPRFQTLELTFAEFIELEAMQRVVGLAQSGDLEIEPQAGQVRAVTAREVIEAYHGQGRYLASRLLRTLLAIVPLS